MGQKSIILAVGLIIFTIILAAILVISRARGGTDKKTTTKEETPIATPIDNTIPALDIFLDPMVYDGLNVEVESTVSDWVTKKAFTIRAGQNQTGIFTSNNNNRTLLVIATRDFKLKKETKGKTISLGQRGTVHIKGQSRIVDREELAKLLGVHYDSKTGLIDDKNLIIDDGSIESWVRGSVIIIDTAEMVSAK